MKEKEICLTAHQDLEEFVAAAGNCDFDINVCYDRVMIDAKSFLGMMALGLAKNIKVAYFGSNEQFEHLLEKYVVA